MKVTYHKAQNQLIELFVLLQYTDGFYTQLDANQVELLHDVAPDITTLTTYLNEQHDAIKQLILRTHLQAIHFVTYLYLTRQLSAPQNLQEYTQRVRQLKEEDYLCILLETIDSQAVYNNREQIYRVLEATDAIEESDKWLWVKAILNPRQHFADLVDFLQDANRFYEPYYEKYARERDTFARHFSLEKTAQQLAFLDKNIVAELHDKEMILVPLSPWLLTFMLMIDSLASDLPFILCIGVRVEQAAQHKQLSDLTLIELLKNLSDTSRYAVLKELTLPHIKAKDIAEKLAITNAAVSYHTQKLLSSGFLVASIDSSESKAKYEINKVLLRDIITKLENDFQL